MESPHYKALVGAAYDGDPRLEPFARFIDAYGVSSVSAYDEDGGRPRHKVFGYADSLQGDPYARAEADARGNLPVEQWDAALRARLY